VRSANGTFFERVWDIADTRSTHKTFDECESLRCLADGEWHSDTHFIGCD